MYGFGVSNWLSHITIDSSNTIVSRSHGSDLHTDQMYFWTIYFRRERSFPLGALFIAPVQCFFLFNKFNKCKRKEFMQIQLLLRLTAASRDFFDLNMNPGV